MRFLLRVTDISEKKWRTIEDSNLWPLPSEGRHSRFVRLMFPVYTAFRSRLARLESAQTVTRNRYRSAIQMVENYLAAPTNQQLNKPLYGGHEVNNA